MASDNDTAENRAAFARHVAIAENRHPLMKYISGPSRTHSQLIASVGYEAWLKHLAEQENATAG